LNVLCLTGWQQRKDELAAITPPDTVHFDYAAYDNAEAMFAALPRKPKVAIGWSLGGQLLVRAVAGGHIQPELLLLLSAPFQCVADAEFPRGMPAPGLKEFRDNYRKHPQETVTQFNALIGLGDSRTARVIRALNKQPEIWNNGLFWLNELAKSSCYSINFSAFPETIIVHGENDKVIDVASANAFAKQLPRAKCILWAQCGHAPHLHNPDSLRTLLSTYV
jgi:pimeloyl-[acyl-carrier protein] methyl ester esterase